MGRGPEPNEGTGCTRGHRLGNQAQILGGQLFTSTFGDCRSKRLVIDLKLRIGPLDGIEWLVELLMAIPVPHTELLLGD